MYLQQNAQAYVSRAAQKHDVAFDMNAPTLEEAKRALDTLVERYLKCQSRLAAWMERNIPEGFTVFSLADIVPA